MDGVSFAERELRLAGWFGKDGVYAGMVGDAVMDLVKVFVEQGHSGMSAPLVAGLFRTVALHEPLTPLLGTDDEWNDLGNGKYQNNRCSHVFKRDGHVYDIEGRVFRQPNGCCYTSLDSRTDVTFPYTPTVEYVDVPAEPAE